MIFKFIISLRGRKNYPDHFYYFDKKYIRKYGSQSGIMKPLTYDYCKANDIEEAKIKANHIINSKYPDFKLLRIYEVEYRPD